MMFSSRRSFHYLCTALLVSLAACAPGDDDAPAPAGPMVVGEAVPADVDSPAFTSSSEALALVWQHELHYPGASYIAPHFSRFALPEGAYLVVRTPDSRRSYTYAGRGNSRPDRDGFWALHMPGDTAIIELYSATSIPGRAVRIDQFARGLDLWKEWQEEPLAAASTGELETEALCGADDSLEARCYQSSEPQAYTRARAVARLMINGTSACTGWLVGSEGHVMTTQQCIATAADAANTTFEFMAEGADCNTDCKTWGGCPGTVEATTSTLVKVSSNFDYALVQLPTNVSSTYGYLQMRDVGAKFNERIYIPQHPAAWGKRIAMKDGANDAIITTRFATACSGTGYYDVGYYADTQGGSLGAPVIGYSDHLVVALHHCDHCPNRGVPIDRIITDLSTDLPADSVASGCSPMPVADAGPDLVICLGDSVTIGTIEQPDHTYSWSPAGATSAQITVSPAATTTYTLTASTFCGNATDTVAVLVDHGISGSFSEDFESGASGWTVTGLWHLTDDSSCATPGYASATHAMYYGQDSTCNYNTGTTNTGSLTSPPIAGINGNSVLSFAYFRQVESYSGSFDRTIVEVSGDDGATWTPVWSRDSSNASENAWTPSGDISLASFTGMIIQVRFRFDSRDSSANSFIGWFIDDVSVSGESSCPPPNAAPSVTITAPASGSTVTGGLLISFSGAADDLEDGDLTDSLIWTSSLDGAIGTGASFSSLLSVGVHMITAEVTDSGGSGSSATITIEVVAPPDGLSEDFEGDVSGWTTSGLWHLTDDSSCATPGYSSATRAMYYGQDSTCNYNTGSTTSGALVSPPIGGITTNSRLSFQYFRQVESYSGDYDRTEVSVSADGGITWTVVWALNSRDASENAWTASGDISLATFAGTFIQIRFRFDSRDGVSNAFTGWFVDDISVE
jgi:hypothetical protein